MDQATAAAFLSLFARFTKVLFRADCAVTAELSLSGQLFPVGSVELKVRGAKENGVKRVVVSEEDYARLPDVWKEDQALEVLQARTAYELIRLCHDENECGFHLAHWAWCVQLNCPRFCFGQILCLKGETK